MYVMKPRKIATARHALAVRQLDLALAVGISQQHVSRIEVGLVKTCTDELAHELCRQLNLDIADVFSEIEVPHDRSRTQRRVRKAAA